MTKESTSTCCVVKVNESHTDKLFYYHNQHWIGLSGQTLRQKCWIEKVKTSKSAVSESSISVQEAKSKFRISTDFTNEDLMRMPEMNPNRGIFPRGNVGTTDDEYRQIIKKCQMPTSVLKSLKLDFTKRKPKRYQALPHKYNNNILKPKSFIIETRNRHFIASDNIPDNPQLEKDPPTQNNDTIVISDDDSEDDFGMEGWEIHQAFNEDGSLARRNHKLTEDNINFSAGTKERSYENEIELTWEKGGSGLVFHTDEATWKEFESDGDIFNEEGFNQWDQDNSAFYDPHGGDKDAKDFVNMKRDELRRSGNVPEEKLRDDLINSFGGKILKDQGWKDGSLNSDNSGLVDPIRTEYRHPADKGGLGYHGEKIKPSNKASKRPEAVDRIVKITTIHDDPNDHDLFPELAHRRNNPTSLKYRRLDTESLNEMKNTLSNNLNCFKRPMKEERASVHANTLNKPIPTVKFIKRDILNPK